MIMMIIYGVLNSIPKDILASMHTREEMIIKLKYNDGKHLTIKIR